MTTPRLDECLHVVSDHRRRRIIQHLRREADGVATIDDLVDRLYRGGQVTDGDRHENRERIAIQLYHHHLPTLADHGVVQYDPESGTILYEPDEQIEAVLDSVPDGVSVANA